MITPSTWRRNYMALKLLLLVVVAILPFFDIAIGWTRVTQEGSSLVDKTVCLYMCRDSLGVGWLDIPAGYADDGSDARHAAEMLAGPSFVAMLAGSSAFQCQAGGLGFGFGTRWVDWASWAHGPMSAIQIPSWIILYAAALPFILGMFGWSTRRTRELGNQCLHCGYDLRASTDRCPECGNPTPSPHPSPTQPNAQRHQPNSNHDPDAEPAPVPAAYGNCTSRKQREPDRDKQLAPPHNQTGSNQRREDAEQ